MIRSAVRGYQQIPASSSACLLFSPEKRGTSRRGWRARLAEGLPGRNGSVTAAVALARELRLDPGDEDDDELDDELDRLLRK